MRRFILLVMALFLAACNRQSNGTNRVISSVDEIEVARAFLERLHQDRSYRVTDTVRDLPDKDSAERRLLMGGLLKILQRGTPDERQEMARVLGRIGDPSAIAPLVATLTDADKRLREESCYALEWLKATGEPAESVLVNLRRTDPEVDVRVAAASALGRPGDKEAVAAFELGARSTKSSSWVRDYCEDQLEKMGKLRLPLPDEVYGTIDRTGLERMMGLRTHVRRKIRRGNYVYVEVVEGFPDGVPAQFHWYRMKKEPEDVYSTRIELVLEDGALVNCLALNPDDTQLASGNESGVVRVWQLNTGKVVHELNGDSAVLRVAFSPDGHRIASAGRNGTVRIWDLSTDRVVLNLNAPANFAIDNLAFGSDGETLRSTSAQGKKIQCWNATSAVEARSISLPVPKEAEVTAIAFSNDGGRLALAIADSNVLICDSLNGTKIAATKMHAGWVSHLAFSPDGRRLACAGESIVVLDTENGSELAGPDVTMDCVYGRIHAVTFSSEGTTMASVTSKNEARTQIVATGEVNSFKVPGRQVTRIALAERDGLRLVTANWDDDGTITIWKIAR
jgi:WD40 repeat protein